MKHIRSAFVDFLAGLGFVTGIIIGFSGMRDLILTACAHPTEFVWLSCCTVLGCAIVVVGRFVREA